MNNINLLLLPPTICANIGYNKVVTSTVRNYLVDKKWLGSREREQHVLGWYLYLRR